MNRTKTRIMFAASFLGLALAGGSASAQPSRVPPPRAGLAVERVRTLGTGCKDASAARVGFSPGGDQLVVRYAPGSLGLEAGPGVPSEARGSYCRLQLNLRIPSGYSYAITAITHEGYAELGRGVTARRTALYWFPGMIPLYRTVSLAGPFSGDYALKSEFGDTARYSACGSSAPLFLLTNVGLSNLENPRAMGAMDSEEEEEGPTIRYHLAWQRCGM